MSDRRDLQSRSAVPLRDPDGTLGEIAGSAAPLCKLSAVPPSTVSKPFTMRVCGLSVAKAAGDNRTSATWGKEHLDGQTDFSFPAR